MGVQIDDFVAGWIGGAAGVIASHPLDTIKVRLQTSTRYKGTVDCMFQTFKKEGTRGFFKGMSFPLASVPAYNALVFGVYSNTTKVICQWRYCDPDHPAQYTDMCAAAMITGAASVAVGAPVDLVKIRLQTQTTSSAAASASTASRSTVSEMQSGPLVATERPTRFVTAVSFAVRELVETGKVRCGGCVELPDSWSVKIRVYHASSHGATLIHRAESHSQQSARRFAVSSPHVNANNAHVITRSRSAGRTFYGGPLHCVNAIYHDQGIRGLYRGAPAMILRDIPGYACYFVPYAMLCSLFTEEDKQTSAGGLLLAGGLAGVISWGVTHPIDTIKSRLQSDNGSRQPKFHGVIDCIRKSSQAHGPSIFFRGLTVNALRGFPQSAALFFGYEMSMRAFRNFRDGETD